MIHYFFKKINAIIIQCIIVSIITIFVLQPPYSHQRPLYMARDSGVQQKLKINIGSIFSYI